VASIIDTNGARPERQSRRRLDAHERRTNDCQARSCCHDKRQPSDFREGRDCRETLSSSPPFNTRAHDVRHEVSVERHSEWTVRGAQITGHNVRIDEQIDFFVGTRDGGRDVRWHRGCRAGRPDITCGRRAPSTHGGQPIGVLRDVPVTRRGRMTPGC